MTVHWQEYLWRWQYQFFIYLPTLHKVTRLTNCHIWFSTPLIHQLKVIAKLWAESVDYETFPLVSCRLVFLHTSSHPLVHHRVLRSTSDWIFALRDTFYIVWSYSLKGIISGPSIFENSNLYWSMLQNMTQIKHEPYSDELPLISSWQSWT